MSRAEPSFAASWLRAGGLVATAFALITPTASAQQLDAGRLALREGGQRVGIESFRVWEAGPNLNSVASVEPSGNRAGEFQVGVEIGGQWRPVRYQLIGPGNREVRGEWAVDRVRLHSVTAEGESWKELASRGPGMVVEVGVAHHYLLLVRVLQENGGRADVVIPLRNESVTAELVSEQPTEITLEDRSISATRYDLRVGGGNRRVWIDAEGRLLRVVDPDSGREAVRLPPR